jgi:hypothetical protein
MRKGSLVRVRLNLGPRTDEHLGEVLDYRPDVLGGTSSQSWTDRQGIRHNEFITHPRRGQVLVLVYEDGSAAWWDEQNVVEVKDGS